MKTMKTLFPLARLLPLVPLTLLSLAACATFPAPAERLAQAEAGARAAAEMGAPQEPTAALHLKMATDQLTEAKQLMANGENEKADAVLQRAQADAELALQLTKEAKAKAEARAVGATISMLQTQNITNGVAQ
jgi:hypothetical protein